MNPIRILTAVIRWIWEPWHRLLISTFLFNGTGCLAALQFQVLGINWIFPIFASAVPVFLSMKFMPDEEWNKPSGMDNLGRRGKRFLSKIWNGVSKTFLSTIAFSIVAICICDVLIRKAYRQLLYKPLPHRIWSMFYQQLQKPSLWKQFELLNTEGV